MTNGLALFQETTDQIPSLPRLKLNKILLRFIETYSGGYDVFVTLEKAGENKLEGSLMNMFDATGERSQ